VDDVSDVERYIPVATGQTVRRDRRCLRVAAAGVLLRRYRWWSEIVVVVCFAVAYEATRALAPAAPARAMSNAHELLALERTLGLTPEAALNRALVTLDWLSTLASYYYLTLHFAVTFVALALLYRGRPQLYARARSSLVVASYVALLAYWFLPVAPPRFAEPGMVDVVLRHHAYGMGGSHPGQGSLADVYAAMPSLHVGWALWVALAAHRAWRTPWRHLGWMYPVLTTLVVFSTGNHYLLDAVAGGALVLGADLLVGRLARHRPHRSTVRESTAALVADLGSGGPPCVSTVTHPGEEHGR
jgi:hypothetical protein